MLKRIITFSLAIITIISLSLISLPVSAQSSIINNNDTNYETGSYDADDILGIVINVTNIILGLVGSLTLLMFIYGGFSFIMAAGSSEKVSKAKGILTAAVVGLVIVFSSYLIIKFVLGALGRDDFEGKQMEIKKTMIDTTNNNLST